MEGNGRKVLRITKNVRKGMVAEASAGPADNQQNSCCGFSAGEMNLSDLGASARARHHGGVVIEAREVSVQGNVVMVGAKAKYECLLDHLLDSEVIEPVLYDAGVWLRSLYLRTRQSEGVSRYGDLGYDRDAGRTSYGPEMSDEQAWNLKVLRDTMLSMGAHWAAVRRLCCDDRMPASRQALTDGLSELAKLRGFY